ncbi:uncharacterized protein TRUGW13939_09349 [Talaromyces rugulosus]|uniref:RTA1 like protein n=1 Tax=Talaromyces rugulosus TaxID=121627 RepID=A0A7H8R758_TALRU|nr:uncharacterized protein TRUGW13939_09349 [Talaromyces rugulosus]QKX62190.1 hypothetical protein TRUGW13939_09349 [Talaromyces rugulosus]
MKVSFYDYDPSLAAAAIFAALYGVCFIWTTYLWLKHRAWVCLIMVVASAMESVGYIARCISTQNQQNQSIYVLQFSLTVLAPLLVAAFCYILFGRLTYLVIPRESRTWKVIWVPPRFVTPIFVFFDILALFLQLIGAVMLTSTDATDANAQDKINRGKDIALIGTIVQLAAFGLFTFVAVRFNFTSKRFEKSVYQEYNNDSRYNTADEHTLQMERETGDTNWRALLRVVNIATILVLVRTIYRLVEFTEGNKGYVNEHEWCIYIFDALVILPCFALFVLFHPAKYLPYLGFRLPKHAR